MSAFSGSVTAQERPPSEAELRSIYCVEALRVEITLQQHMISASSEAAGVSDPQQREQWIDTSAELLKRLKLLEGAHDRLGAWMLPRIASLDARALAAAIRRANAEAQGSSSDDAVLNELRACEAPTWLPP